VRIALRALAPALAVVLVPKCPLCLATYLSVIGVTAGVAAPWIRVLQPALAVVAVLTLGAVVLRLARQARSYLARRGSCGASADPRPRRRRAISWRPASQPPARGEPSRTRITPRSPRYGHASGSSIVTSISRSSAV
jgi:hypothetical protein